jgi:hypothetical protein
MGSLLMIQWKLRLTTSNTKVKQAMIAALFLLLTSQAMALPSKGYWIPRTHTMAFGEIKYDLQIQQGPEKGTPNQNVTQVGFLGGFVEWEKFYVEAGGDWIEPTQDDLLYGIIGNAKITYQDVNTDGWAISLGVSDFPIRPGQHDDNLIYTVAEAQITPDWKVAMGGFTGQEERIKTSSGAIVGIWRKIQMGAGDIGVEWMSGQGKYGYIVPGIRAEVRDGFEAVLAYAIAADRDTYRNLFLTRLMVYF